MWLLQRKKNHFNIIYWPFFNWLIFFIECCLQFYTESQVVSNTMQKENVYWWIWTRKRKAETSVEYLRLDRFGHWFHVRMWRICVGWDSSQIYRWTSGSIVFYCSGNRLIVFRYLSYSNQYTCTYHNILHTSVMVIYTPIIQYKVPVYIFLAILVSLKQQ